MRDIDTEVTRYNLEGYTDYEGSHFEVMEVAEDGWWVCFRDHDNIVMALKDRITYLENVCDEQERMLTGD